MRSQPVGFNIAPAHGIAALNSTIFNGYVCTQLRNLRFVNSRILPCGTLINGAHWMQDANASVATDEGSGDDGISIPSTLTAFQRRYPSNFLQHGHRNQARPRSQSSRRAFSRSLCEPTERIVTVPRDVSPRQSTVPQKHEKTEAYPDITTAKRTLFRARRRRCRHSGRAIALPA